MNDRPNFCANCGVPLSESETHCFACGARSGNAALYGQSIEKQRTDKGMSVILIVAAFLSLLWAMVALTFGLTFFILEHIDFYFFDFFHIEGMMWMISGGLSVITTITAFSRKFFLISLSSCLIASVIVLPWGIVGIVVSIMIIISRSEFKRSKL